MAAKGESIAPKEATKGIRRKRKRAEMEKERTAEVIEIDGGSDDGAEDEENGRSSPWKRLKVSHQRAGRKSSNFGQNGQPTASKSIEKKQSAEREPKETSPEVVVLRVCTPKSKKGKKRRASSSAKESKGSGHKKGSKRSKTKKKKTKKGKQAEGDRKQQRINDLFKSKAI